MCRTHVWVTHIRSHCWEVWGRGQLAGLGGELGDLMCRFEVLHRNCLSTREPMGSWLSQLPDAQHSFSFLSLSYRNILQKIKWKWDYIKDTGEINQVESQRELLWGKCWVSVPGRMCSSTGAWRAREALCFQNCWGLRGGGVQWKTNNKTSTHLLSSYYGPGVVENSTCINPFKTHNCSEMMVHHLRFTYEGTEAQRG